jgi:LAO/AO transport system kinase
VNRNDTASLVAGLKDGRRAAIARLLSWAEDRDPRVDEALRDLYPTTGAAHRLGITGPPGAGKSTLIARVVSRLRARNEDVAVVAVDPSSPFTGGALLGDRIRMTEISEDPAVFVRSMATRGSRGGLAAATEDALDLLDAAGYRRLVVETVGVGQVELDVAMAADTVVVVLVPESGDGVQAMKAGLMEIGDVFAVNKADREGADRLVREIEQMLELRDDADGWRPPVVPVTALRGDGIVELLAAVDAHRAHVTASGGPAAHRREAVEARILAESRRVWQEQAGVAGEELLGRLVDQVAKRERIPRDAARDLVEALKRS